MEPTNNPRRRVGSFTLGACLILAGAALLLYYFWPGFNFVLAARLSPLILVALGIEVLLSAARPESRRYDFLSVFLCLFLLAATCMVSVIPALWDYIGPQHNELESRLSRQLEASYYERLKDCDVTSLSTWLHLSYGRSPASVSELNSEDSLYVSVRLTGPYDSREAFAQSCHQVLSGILAEGTQVDQIDFTADAAPRTRPASSRDTAPPSDMPPDYETVQPSPVSPEPIYPEGYLHVDPDEDWEVDEDEYITAYELSVSGPYQLSWSAEQLAAVVCEEF